MNKYLATIISDLLRFEIKQSERHGLDSIRITLPRAKEIVRDLRETMKEAKPLSHWDRIANQVENARLADYSRQ